MKLYICLLHLPCVTKQNDLQIHQFSPKRHDSVFFMGEDFQCVHVLHFPYHYSVDGHVACFCFSAFVNSAAVDMDVQGSLWHVDLEWEST